MRSRKTILNMVFSLALQVATVIANFIIPRYVIIAFGSSVNGLIASITQFLGYIVLLESGVGGVIRASLYKPLAIGDNKAVNTIIRSAEKFFRNVAYLLILYVLLLSTLYPSFIIEEFSRNYIVLLIIAIGLSVFIRYYFGITYSILLQADQRQYVASAFQIIALLANTIIAVFLIKLGASIHIVILGSSVVLAIKPILQHYYVKKRYRIRIEKSSSNYKIEQRWDGLGHHLAFFLHRSTDIIVLTLFAPIKEVSVYVVYYLITAGVSKFVSIFATGIEAAFGNMIANNEKETLNKTFNIMEFIIVTITAILFASTVVLILPFVMIYTKGVTDVNYIRPVFAYLLIVAEVIFCLRMPFQAVVLAAGHYKQTKKGAFVEALINITLSIVLVQFWGVIGVAIATVISMFVRTAEYVVYLSNNILNRPVIIFVRRIAINMLSSITTIVIASRFSFLTIDSFTTWISYACFIVLGATVISLVFNYIFYRQEIKTTYYRIKSILGQK